MKLFFNFGLFFILTFTIESIAQNSPSSFGVFSFQDSVTVAGNPNYVYDNISGNIKPWWDHTMSQNPDSLFIEAKPGGGFYEYFDNNANGARHAVVILADRGKVLRFDGPLGLSGRAIQLVCTYNFYEINNDSTKIILTVNASGQINKGLKNTVASVWHHFLHERFANYMLEKKEN